MMLELNKNLNDLSNQELLIKMQTICDKHELQKVIITKLLDKYDYELLKLKNIEKDYLDIVNVLVDRNILDKKDLEKYEN